MSEKSALGAPPANSAARTGVAIVGLIAIAAFLGYGFFERSRLIASQVKEKEAIAVITKIKGAVMESDSKDWRQIFVPDKPEAAVRVGTVTVPIMGEGPDYTNKVVEQLRVFGLCEQLYLADAPVERDPNSSFGMGGGKPKPKEEVKKDDGQKQPLEMLEVAVIKKEFPNLKIVGAETAAKDAAEKLKAKEEAAARKKSRESKKDDSTETKTAAADGGEKKTGEEKKGDTKSADAPADKPAESDGKKEP